MLVWLTFGLLAAGLLTSAILAITRGSPAAGVAWLAVTLFAAGGVYLTLRAGWLFTLQLILCAGGICGLLCWTTSVTRVVSSARHEHFDRRWGFASGVTVVLAAELGYAFCRGYRDLNPPPVTAPTLGASWPAYVLPAELAFILWVVAATGVVMMTQKKIE